MKAIPRPLRIVAFALIAAFMAFGPVVRQVLGERVPPFRPWMMFSTMALDLADVRFSQRSDDGSLVPLDHYAVLGYRDWREAPLNVRRIRGLDGVHAMAASLCQAMDGEPPDLRARVRIATREGWRTEIFESDGNLCGRSPALEGARGPDPDLD